MSNLIELISFDNPIFTTYAFWSAVLVLKMLFMSQATSMQRFKKKAFINPEDVQFAKGAKITKDEDVERVRRAHMNDLENIPVLLIVELFYIATNPNAFIATNLIRLAAIMRIVHSTGYLMASHKARGGGFAVTYIITFLMAIASAIHFF